MTPRPYTHAQLLARAREFADDGDHDGARICATVAALLNPAPLATYRDLDGSLCLGCGAPLLDANHAIADGCPCNSARGINHARVPAHVCTCRVCDPAGTGAVRPADKAGGGAVQVGDVWELVETGVSWVQRFTVTVVNGDGSVQGYLDGYGGITASLTLRADGSCTNPHKTWTLVRRPPQAVAGEVRVDAVPGCRDCGAKLEGRDDVVCTKCVHASNAAALAPAPAAQPSIADRAAAKREANAYKRCPECDGDASTGAHRVTCSIGAAPATSPSPSPDRSVDRPHRDVYAELDKHDPVPAGELQLDPGIRRYVLLLRAEGVETFESCGGGQGHAYREPTIAFYGNDSEGHRAFAVAMTYGLPVSRLSRYYSCNDRELCGPHWALTFSSADKAAAPAQPEPAAVGREALVSDAEVERLLDVMLAESCNDWRDDEPNESDAQRWREDARAAIVAAVGDRLRELAGLQAPEGWSVGQPPPGVFPAHYVAWGRSDGEYPRGVAPSRAAAVVSCIRADGARNGAEACARASAERDEATAALAGVRSDKPTLHMSGEQDHQASALYCDVCGVSCSAPDPHTWKECAVTSAVERDNALSHATIARNAELQLQADLTTLRAKLEASEGERERMRGVLGSRNFAEHVATRVGASQGRRCAIANYSDFVTDLCAAIGEAAALLAAPVVSERVAGSNDTKGT